MDANTFTHRLRASEKTKDRYGSVVRQYLRWLNGRKETPDSAQKYVDSLADAGQKPSSVSTAGNGLRAFWRVQNKSLTIYVPKVQLNPPAYYRMDEIKLLFAACEEPLEVELLTLLYDTGARISEILGIKIDEIDLEAKTAKVVRKGGRDDFVTLSADGVAAVEKILAMGKRRQGKLFGNITYNHAYVILNRVAKRAGLEGFNIHRLRHSVAFDMGIRLKAEGGQRMDILHAIQQILGHTSIATTANVYGQLFPEDKVGLRGSGVADALGERRIIP